MDIVNRFLNFDKLMGPWLVRIVYYLGIIGILLGVVAGILGGFGAMGVFGFGAGIGMVIGAPIGGVLGICFWRFVCELYIVLFRVGDDIAAIRSGGSGLGISSTTIPKT